MLKSRIFRFLIPALIALVAVSTSAGAAPAPTNATPVLTTTTGTTVLGPRTTPMPPDLDPTVAWRETWVCDLAGPAGVQGYRVACTAATFLDFAIADCCIAGDHWQLKGKNWDNAPNTAVTTSPGGLNVFGLRSRVYNYGGTATNPRNIDTYVECTYRHGVDFFGASSFVNFSSDGNCVVTPDAVRNRIDREP